MSDEWIELSFDTSKFVFAQMPPHDPTLRVNRIAVIQEFVDRVCKRAEENMAKTNTPEGMHYAAMMKELELLKASKDD